MKKNIAIILTVFILFLVGCEPVELSEYRGEITPAVSDVQRAEVLSSENSLPKKEEVHTETEDEKNISPLDMPPEYENSDLIQSPYGVCYNLTDEVILYGKGMDEKIYPSGASKLLTALVAIQNVPDDFTFVIGDEIGMIYPESRTVGLLPGQKLERRGIITALLLPSGNDAAYSIAVNVSRYLLNEDLSDKEYLDYFLELMNIYAKNIGVENSSFSNPCGLYEDDNYTTVRDLLKISAAAAKNPLISDISSKKSITVDYISGEQSVWESRHFLTGLSDWDLKGFMAAFTDEADYSFTGLVSIDGKDYITIVTGSKTDDIRCGDTEELFELSQSGGNVSVAYITD